MRQCSHCGAPLDSDALFCTECGTQQAASAPTGRTCPACGASIDADSLFCSECGSPVGAPTPTGEEEMPVAVAEANSGDGASSPEPAPEQTVETPRKESRGTLIAVIAALALLLACVGGYFYYDNIYLPQKIDREAPRYYTMANAVVLRSSKSSGADYNKIGSLPYGTELITYERDKEWSKVKVNSTAAAADQRQEGYVFSPLLLNKHDFFLLNSIFGDTDSKECVATTKCRLALLIYFKSQGYIGKIDEQLRKEAGIATVPSAANQWQIFCKPQEAKTNSVLFKRLVNRQSRFTDFAVIIQNLASGKRKLLYFYFDEDETPHLFAEQDAPNTGYLRNILMNADGSIKASYGL